MSHTPGRRATRASITENHATLGKKYIAEVAAAMKNLKYFHPGVQAQEAKGKEADTPADRKKIQEVFKTLPLVSSAMIPTDLDKEFPFIQENIATATRLTDEPGKNFHENLQKLMIFIFTNYASIGWAHDEQYAKYIHKYVVATDWTKPLPYMTGYEQAQEEWEQADEMESERRKRVVHFSNDDSKNIVVLLAQLVKYAEKVIPDGWMDEAVKNVVYDITFNRSAHSHLPPHVDEPSRDGPGLIIFNYVLLVVPRTQCHNRMALYINLHWHTHTHTHTHTRPPVGAKNAFYNRTGGPFSHAVS